MSDISIIRTKNFAHVVGVTTKGQTWIRENMFMKDLQSVQITINIDYADEMLEDLLKAGLEVNYK